MFSVTEIEVKDIKVVTTVSCAFFWSLSLPELKTLKWLLNSSRVRLAASRASWGRTVFIILMFTLIPSLLIQNFQGQGMDIYMFSKAV